MLIAQITDLHVAAEGPGLGLVDTAAHLDAAIDHLNAMSPQPEAGSAWALPAAIRRQDVVATVAIMPTVRNLIGMGASSGQGMKVKGGRRFAYKLSRCNPIAKSILATALSSGVGPIKLLTSELNSTGRSNGGQWPQPSSRTL